MKPEQFAYTLLDRIFSWKVYESGIRPVSKTVDTGNGMEINTSTFLSNHSVFN